MSKATAYELVSFHNVDPDAPCYCPYCMKSIEKEYDSDEEYYFFEGSVYHIECVEKIIEEYGVEFLKSELEEYAEWRLDCRFNEFYLPPEVVDALLSDEGCNKAYILDEVETFLKWYEENF